MKIVPDQIAPWLNGRLVSLGTDGFGRSDSREHLRRHFEINAESIVAATVLNIRGESYRLKEKRQAGVSLSIPLAETATLDQQA